MTPSKAGQKELFQQVMETGLCTACGACATFCPYLASYRDRTVILDPCDLNEGKCHAVCPRISLPLADLRRRFFPAIPETTAVGPLLTYHQARGVNRGPVQHGGLVSALLETALAEKVVEAVVLADKQEGLVPQATTVTRKEEILPLGGSRFFIHPLLGELKAQLEENKNRVGLVALPCQLQGLAKLCHTAQEKEVWEGASPLVIGLFCGFRLPWREFPGIVKRMTKGADIIKMDLPSQRKQLDLTTKNGTFPIPLEEITPHVKEACRYCIDTTSEFSDLAVGLAPGLPVGGEIWNQVLIRTRRGEELFRLARERGLIEARTVSRDHLEELQQAALAKKYEAIRNLQKKSGRRDHLLYLDPADRAVKVLLEKMNSSPGGQGHVTAS